MMTGLFIAGAAHQMARAHRDASASERAARTASDVRRQNEAISLDIEKLFMITEALWTLLKEQHGYTDECLGQMVQDIDLRSGKLDGKRLRPQAPVCVKCRRTLIGGHPVCLYCGTMSTRTPFE